MLNSLISSLGSMRNTGAQSVSEKETGKSRATSSDNAPDERYSDQVSLSYVSHQNKSMAEIGSRLSGTDKFQHTLTELKIRYEQGALDYYSADPYENQIRLGITAIGGYEQLKRWEDKGLELEEDTLITSGQIYSEALRRQNNGGTYTKKGLLMNQHGLVQKNQTVPDWFKEEQLEFHDQISGAASRAFKQGYDFIIR